MTTLDTIQAAYKGLTTSKGRSLLTILGIVIGIMAIMIVMSLGAGARELILGQVDALGARIIFVSAGRQDGGPPQLTESLKERDITELKKRTNVPNATAVFGTVFTGTRLQHESETYDGFVQGVTAEWERVFDITPAAGEFITEDDVRSNADVAVIGHTVRTKLFGTVDPIGKQIKVENKNLRIVGYLPEKGRLSIFGFDESILVPLSTVQTSIIGKKSFNNLIIEVDTEKNITSTVKDIEQTLRFTHSIQEGEKDDFNVRPQQDLADRLGAITGAFSAFLIAVAAISLVVGGVGIMNIMLVSVSERTREIGLRKAIGARNRDVLKQFLFEATMLTGIGGIIGIALGGLFSYGAAQAIRAFAGLDWSFEFPIQGMIIGLIVSVSIGLVFGIYPARKAAQKSPTEALRYE